MEFSVFGYAFGALGLLILFRGSGSALLSLLIIGSLFGAAAAINLPALGGASIQPAYFTLSFLLLSLARNKLIRMDTVAWTMRENIFLVVLVAYGVVGAYVLPRMFVGAMEVAPMRQTTLDMSPYAADLLVPSTQNITQAVYLIGTLITAMGAAIVTRAERRLNALVVTMLGVSWAHIGFGLLDLALFYGGQPTALDVFRNASYAQLSQQYSGFHRISGIMPEPSGYATYAFLMLVFSTELWLRNIRPGLSGVTAAALVGVLVLCTSTAGYLALAAYAVLLTVRMGLSMPTGPVVSKLVVLLSFVFVVMTAIVIFTLINPHLTAAMVDALYELTANKAASASGVQRAFWIKQGLDAFVVSSGLGVGPGSFRSSSLFTSIIGSMGVIGIVSFVLYLFKVLKPFRPNTYILNGLPAERLVGAACGWAAVVGLTPAAVSGATPDPGFLFAVFAGASIAWCQAPAVSPLIAGAGRPPQGRRNLKPRRIQTQPAPPP